MTIDAMSSKIQAGFQEWKGLREKGDDRSETERKKTGALGGYLYSDCCRLSSQFEKVLSEEPRGREAIAASSELEGMGVAFVRAYREATDQHPV